ncbi:tRNA (guanosine(37)-N1)-methyltransferase TrmD [Rubellicoccus peritrichatus]|uniref:tRNA (guanine-N(1)-)-methyltransferase n=1 Tax=Rubellicoccus peritrichatus TaxID=3080537 RepID=A0AAQ3L9V6_9BACT|nr:tRNA (guanosine(37)-N1)-methyltransferase TrmD [Puniceicoccus sp. CR14]WOO41516.1 tRNA (guanosine(37)-N1)-methyltransferase TrmD [Puniceicoccus sp. CR14]
MSLKRIDIITLFPAMADAVLAESMIGRAQRSGAVEIQIHNLRDWSKDKHNTVDDRPFGGGAGMLLKPEPLFDAIESLKTEDSTVIFLCPDGEQLGTPLVRDLAEHKHLILISGHYDGIDQRVRDMLVDREISIGDYVLTNGTLPALVLVDCVCRYIPGVLGEEKSLTQDSFHDSLLGFPQFTRPAEFRGVAVPEILLSGDHKAVERWRKEEQINKTRERRPDLLDKQPE